ncbi:YheT family hydrolase [Chitinasiproducens palmae]|uniref:AB hydrolase-1 domain-containing protein n=1 Tax=Chitinasiproducens palmae TaxID=1770053 RepID=A0A1H2PWA9_9BURK|nr:alpha/beta fold hydrolase [Chitinasiproducens palmae]SDV51637.1 hypothetical protein SAMN05216551_12025 [Chitinasiproducens palmae]
MRAPAGAVAGPAPHTSDYPAPWWLPGGHLQTILPATVFGAPPVAYRRERWTTPDDDFIDVDWHATSAAPATSGRPLLVLFHGLEGSAESHYARALMTVAAARGWQAAVPHFRSCSGELNRLPRFYHSGDAAEIDWILRRMRARAPHAPLFVAGVSLGANALLCWLGQQAQDAAWVRAAAAVSAPIDLERAGDALGRGLNMIYTRHFLATLKRKSLAKLARFPGLFDADAVRAARDLRAFDDLVTAPLHGFAGVDDYWRRASSRRWLQHIAVPTLLLNAANDPFTPLGTLPGPGEVSPSVLIERPAQGGHVGFATGTLGEAMRRTSNGWLAARLAAFFDDYTETDHG